EHQAQLGPAQKQHGEEHPLLVVLDAGDLAQLDAGERGRRDDDERALLEDAQGASGQARRERALPLVPGHGARVGSEASGCSTWSIVANSRRSCASATSSSG